MNTIKFATVLVSAAALISFSCQNSTGKPDGDLYTPASSSLFPNSLPDSNRNAVNTQQADPAQTAQTAEPVQTASSEAVVLNPAHGQPGHRCDLEVGAPITGPAPATTAAAQPTANPLPAQNNPTPNNTVTVSPVPEKNTEKTDIKLNPAHGQPGHRCDLQVGAPLSLAEGQPAPKSTDSATATPVANVTQSAPASVLPNLPSVVPAKTTANTESTKSGVKLNPAHGQPGHDCSIEVGKPLKKS